MMGFGASALHSFNVRLDLSRMQALTLLILACNARDGFSSRWVRGDPIIGLDALRSYPRLHYTHHHTTFFPSPSTFSFGNRQLLAGSTLFHTLLKLWMEHTELTPWNVLCIAWTMDYGLPDSARFFRIYTTPTYTPLSNSIGLTPLYTINKFSSYPTQFSLTHTPPHFID